MNRQTSRVTTSGTTMGTTKSMRNQYCSRALCSPKMSSAEAARLPADRATRGPLTGDAGIVELHRRAPTAGARHPRWDDALGLSYHLLVSNFPSAIYWSTLAAHNSSIRWQN